MIIEDELGVDVISCCTLPTVAARCMRSTAFLEHA